MYCKAIIPAIVCVLAGISCGTPPTAGLESPPLSVSLSANPTVVTLPGNTTLSATIKNAVSCTSSWSGNVPSTDRTYPVPITLIGVATFSLTCTDVNGVSKTAQVTVEGRDPPKLGVRIIGAEPMIERIPVGMRAKIERGSIVETVDFDQLGKASFIHANEDSLCITIDTVNSSSRLYYPSRACVKQRDFNKEQIFVLIPFIWNGDKVDLTEAFDTTGSWPTADPRSFYPWATTNLGIFYLMRTWPENKLPIPVAYNRGRSTTDITSAETDSIEGIVNRLNLELGKSRTGKDFFKFGNFADLNPQGNIFDGISIVVDSTSIYPGSFGVIRYSGYSSIAGNVVSKLKEGILHEGILKHELIHSLGAGHTQRWPSIMGTNPGFCGATHCFSPQPKDILYTRLLHRVHEIRLKYSAQYEILEAYQGYRTVVLALSP